jgi:hypothetical protein
MSGYSEYVGWQLLTMLYSSGIFIFVLYPLTRGPNWSLFRSAVVAVLIGGCLAYLSMSEVGESEPEPVPTAAPAAT